MPEKVINIDNLIDGGSNYKPDPNAKATPDIHDPKGDVPVDFELFERRKHGENLTQEDLGNKPTLVNKDEKPLDDKAALDKEEQESAAKLEERKRLAEEAEKKQEEEAKKVEKEAEDKEEKPAPPTAKPTARPPQQQSQDDINAIVKDLGLPETSSTFFKKMDKGARDFVVAELKRGKAEVETTKAALETAKKSTRGDIPANWYEHKNAYALLPDYQKAKATANEVKGYISHMREQLIAIEDGQDWIDLRLNQQTGQIHHQPMKTTSETATRAKYDILRRISELEKIEHHQDMVAQEVAGNFIQYHKTLKEDVRAMEDEYFPQYKDDGEFKNNEFGKYAYTMLESNGQGNNPIAGMFAKLYAFALDTQRENQELKKSGKSTIPPVRGQGPTGHEIDKGSGEDSTAKKYLKGDDAPFDEDEFDRVKHRGHLIS